MNRRTATTRRRYRAMPADVTVRVSLELAPVVVRGPRNPQLAQALFDELQASFARTADILRELQEMYS
jgi:hypothetical protein